MVYGPPAGFVRNKPAAFLNRAYCTGCGKCVKVCPQHGRVLSMGRDDIGPHSVIIDEMACAGCGMCVSHCPTHAIGVRHVEVRSASHA